MRVGAIVIDMSPDTPWAASNRVDPVQLVHENLFGRLARRALDQAIDSRTIKPQWNTLVGNLYPHLTRRQFPKPVAELRSDEQQKRQYAQQLSPRLVEQTGNPGDWMYPQYDLANTVADSLAEYILFAYGRAVVPDLLDALSEYQAWEEVVVAVFAIAPEQFTAEWHAYLQQYYPIDLAQPY
ncbi:MAG: hypothetical protein R2867_10345 [Caldilineaceae bacterium]